MRMQRFLKTSETLSYWYSLDSSHRVISYEYPDRAPLKEVLGGQYNYREGGRQVLRLKAAGGIESGSVVRIRAPKK